MRTLLLVALAIVAALLLYGSVVEPRFLLEARSLDVELHDLPDGWDGGRLALMGDLQVGMWLGNTRTAEDAVAEAIDASASGLLIAGDFVYRPDSARIREAVNVVRPAVEAGIPVLAVLGNHDYSIMKESSEINHRLAAYLVEELEAAGARVLQNTAVPLVRGGDSLWVGGVGSSWAGEADVEAVRSALPTDAPRVWLMHNSEAFREIPRGEAPLALAAHTHGGQVRVLPGEHTSWLDIVREGEVAADGWAADTIGQPGNRAYINRGIGFSTVPVRINCRPELTLVTLRRAM